jgi:hypothetical protein
MTSEREYNAIPAVRWSRLKAMRTSALAYRWQEEHPDDDETVALRIGRAVHSMLLEPAKYLVDFAIWPKERRGKEWLAFAAANAHRDIITGKEAEIAEHCVEAIRGHGPAMSILTSGGARFEHTLTWVDAKTQLPCKARVDIVNGRLSDLKTSRHIVPRRFAYQVHQLGYHGQLAFYAMGLEANGFEMEKPPALVAVQNSPPFDVVVFRASTETMDRGHVLARTLLDRLADCRESGEWPGIAPDEEVELHLPSFPDLDDEEEQAVTFDGAALEV